MNTFVIKTAHGSGHPNIHLAGWYINSPKPGEPGVSLIDGIKAMGVRPIIYSGYGMWENVMGKNVTQFSDVPLWDTNVKWEGRDKWDDIKKVWAPNILDPKPIQYGGWNTTANMRVAIQQSFDTVIEGEAVDINTFQASFLK